jgi:hypothetical protein
LVTITCANAAVAGEVTNAGATRVHGRESRETGVIDVVEMSAPAPVNHATVVVRVTFGFGVNPQVSTWY